jgi:hypothetical protein
VGELEAMAQRYSQWLPGEEIPEKHWMYRLAKRFWFNDFGAYNRLEASGGVPAASLKTAQKPSAKQSAAA